MTVTETMDKPISIAILAMGGQGGGVLTEWIVSAGERDNMIVQSTSIPGVAQRTGATIYYLEAYPRNLAEQEKQDPILALMPVPGEVDVVVAGEIIEAGRAMVRGYVSKDKTTLISSRHRDYAIREKMAMADGRVDDQHIHKVAEERSKRLVCFDMADIAEQTGCAISAVILGAIAGSEVLPISRTAFEETIRASGKALEANLKGFAAGFEAVNQPQDKSEKTTEVQTDKPHSDVAKIQTLLDRIYNEFPEAAHTTLLAGVRRLLDYQDERYADEYLNMLKSIADADQDNTLTVDCAKHLALWMSYEDAIRVADLKIRESRFQRVHEEVKANQDQIVYVSEFMHPRVEELCDILPVALGKLILNTPVTYKFINLFCKKGRRISTNKLSGFLLLYFIAGFRRNRSASLRYQNEHQQISIWLNKIRSYMQTDYSLAREIARCQQLIKGYGDTHARGMGNYNKIMAVLDKAADKSVSAQHIKKLREAALADEHGDALTSALNEAA